MYFGAVPYLDAMECFNSIYDNYLEDSASSIVNYFIANAQTWRGETAGAVKEKLKQLLRQKRSLQQSAGTSPLPFKNLKYLF